MHVCVCALGHDIKCMYYYFGGQGKKRFESLHHVILPYFIMELHLGLQAMWPMAWAPCTGSWEPGPPQHLYNLGWK